MNSFILNQAFNFYTVPNSVKITKERFKNGPAFVIGVKKYQYKNGNQIMEHPNVDLDILLKHNPNIVVVERFPEVYNPKYISSTEKDQHILQPAFIDWKD